MELRDYIDVLYNRKWFVVGMLTAVLVLTLVITIVQAPAYESSVKVLADINSSSEALLGEMLPSSLSDTDRFVQNQAQIIQTDALAREVEKQLRYECEQAARQGGSGSAPLSGASVPGAEELSEMVSVKLGAKTGIFEIVVNGRDPGLTRDIARVYSEAYLANRQLASVKQISEARKEIWNRLTEVEEQLQTISNQVKQYKASDVPTDLAASAQQTASLYTTLYEKYITLRISESLGQRGLEIIEAADTGEKVSPKPARNGILAVFLGLILGVGLAFFVDYMDDTLNTREDFERFYGTTIVGEIPFIGTEELPPYHIVYFEKAGHPAVEGYRTLRTNLQFLGLKDGHRSILFTSAMPDEGKSTITVNLGAALSEMGRKVLLVEADLRKPVLSKFFEIAPRNGLTGVLAGACSLQEAVIETGYENLYILPAGVRPPNPGELVASEEMRVVLEKVRGYADYVLVDAPPALAASDALAMAPMVDGVLVVGRYEVAERESARRVAELLGKVDANILGVVINNLESGRRYSYYHYYYYGASGDAGQPVGRRRFRWKPGGTRGRSRSPAPPED